ncbi:hypothetical protein [Brevundimonas naejangsanensis]|nr:hypothetical protein [Brevundimonas naejangsanensis]
MALVQPGKSAPAREVHPVVYFLAGFALIVIAAAVVHTAFGVLL